MIKKTILIAVLALGFLVVMSCDSLFYYPNKKIYREEKDIAQAHEERFIKSQSGNNLHLWYFTAENPKALIIHFHGNARNISAHYKAFAWTLDEGYELISWDYSGYGKSSGKTDREDIYLDSLTMLDYAMQIKKEKGYPLIVIGQSLGGAILLGALGDYEDVDDIDLIMVDCTFSSYKKIANNYVIGIGQFLVSDRYAPYKGFNNIKDVPILVSHCKEDTTIPYKYGELLYSELKNERKWFWELSCKHTAGYWKEDNQKRLLEFFDNELFLKKDTSLSENL